MEQVDDPRACVPERMGFSDFARWLGLSTQYLMERRKEGRVIGVKVGRSYQVDVAETLRRLGKVAPDDVPAPPPPVPASAAPVAVIELPSGRREAVTVPAASAVVVAQRLRPGGRLSGMTKGQFSLLDLMRALLAVTGPADVVISTWSSGIRDTEIAGWLLESGQIRSMQWLVDRSFASRQPEYAAAMDRRFGAGSIATAEVHAKILLLSAGDWRVVVRSSMNLNRNPRFEQFDIDDDAALYDHYFGALREICQLAGAGFGDKAAAMRVLQESHGGQMAAPDVYAHTETEAKRDAAAAAKAEARGATPPGEAAEAGEEVSYHSERSLHERARRQLAELKLAQARRELVSARAVGGYCGRVGTMVRERVLAIENASLTRMDAAAQLWLAGELRSALTFLADALDREGAGLLEGSVVEVEDVADEAPA